MSSSSRVGSCGSLLRMREGGAWFGDAALGEAGTGRMALEATMRSRGRPMKFADSSKKVPDTFSSLDRFLHHAEIISITGRSYRLKDKGANGKTEKPRKGKDEDERTGKKKTSD